jgi:outer membrane protein assembly factor BamB
MLLTTRVHSRRVLVLGLAGLVPAALVTLLLVHQPSIGERRLYPMLRGPLALVGLGLALATLITWATAPDRLSRSSLSGLAWAGVTTVLCIGPFLESTPRSRLYALELESGAVVWESNRAGEAPTRIGDDLVVTDVEARSLVWLDPATGAERRRHRIDGADDESLVRRARAAGAYVPTENESDPTACPVATAAGITASGGELRGAGADGAWSLNLEGEEVRAVAVAADGVYAYVATPRAEGPDAGSIIRIDPTDGREVWRSALSEEMAAVGGCPAIAANGDAVLVAGGEVIGVLDADRGRLRWSHNVVSLGKSRGYALPGAVQRVTVDDARAYLSATPDS